MHPTHRRGPSPSILLMGSLLVLSLLLFPACTSLTSQNTQNSYNLPYHLVMPGVLTVATDATNPPLENTDSHLIGVQGEPKVTGFDIDLITAIAQRIGLKVNIVNTKYQTTLSDLVNGRVDVVMSGMNITPAREEQGDFVPYFTSGQSVLVEAGNPANIHTLTDLCGKKVGIQKYSVEETTLHIVSDDCLQAGKPGIDSTALQDETNVIALLLNHKVMATLQDSPVTDYFNHLNPGKFALGSPVINPVPDGIAVHKGNTALSHAIQTALQNVQANGTYHSIIAKWGLIRGDTQPIPRRS